MSRTALYALAFLLLAAGVLTIVTASSLTKPDLSVSQVQQRATENSTDEAPAAWMTEYTLIERSGREFHSKQLAGKVHVVNFFFSTCPTVCHMQSSRVRELAAEFGPQRVVFVSITCDPDRDTPAVLYEYAQRYDADAEQWLFLTTSDLTYLRRVGGEMYQLPVDKQTHSERLVVVDKWGEIRGRFDWQDAKQVYELRQTLKQLLAEQQPAAGTEKATEKAVEATEEGDQDAAAEQQDDLQSEERAADPGL